MKWMVGLVLLLGLASCHSGRGVAGSPGASMDGNSAATDSVHSENDAMEGKLTRIGPVTVVGTLYHTKGRLGQLDRYILPVDFLTGGNGQPWKPEYEALVGKKVEARGVHFRYRCSPIEQCLEGGVIDYLNELEYLRSAK